jgi:spore coat polysaccharide biosynthesis protein SpsF
VVGVRRTVALVQARVSSARLPGKVLLDIHGEPMLLRVVRRAGCAVSLDDVAVITSCHVDDDAIEEVCLKNKVSCFRGSLDDVLDRYYRAALHFHADVIVRITGDCPLLDPNVVDLVVQGFHEGSYDYFSNVLRCTYPDGLDTEVFHFKTLERTWKEASLKSEREHVTAFIYKHPEMFRLGNMEHPEDLSALRWTVDTIEDLEFVRAVYSGFKEDLFGMNEIVDLIGKNPEIAELNMGRQRNEGYQMSLKKDGEAKCAG